MIRYILGMTAYNFPKSNLDDWLPFRTIFLVRHGSHAYGTNIESSDLDVKGVCIPPSKYYYGYLERFEQFQHHDPDFVVYEIQKFFKLASDCNPSIIEVLFTDERDHLRVTKAGETLLNCRDMFLSKKAKHTFSGYAISQLKRIETHHRWLVNPPKAQPTRKEYGLPEKTLIPADQLGAAESLIKKQIEEWDVALDELDEADKIAVKGRIAKALAEMQCSDQATLAGQALGFSGDFLHVLEQERRYKQKQTEWSQYQNWVATRNKGRAELEAKFGYDTKHAMHLVRLMRMGREILETGKVIVRRPDRDELLAIRAGAWSYEQLIEWAEGMDAQLTTLYKTSNALPMAPDRKSLDYLCQDLVQAGCLGMEPFLPIGADYSGPSL